MAVQKKAGSAATSKADSKANTIESVILTQSLPKPLFDRISKYTKDKYFDSEQAAIRLIIGTHLDRAGY